MEFQKIRSSDTTKWLVIDTNILRSAGSSENLQSILCRNLLVGIFTMCHKMIVNGFGKEEISNHQSKYSVEWIGKMRKIDKFEEKEFRNTFSKALDTNKHLVSISDYPEIEKDTFLYDLALSKDNIIISRETNSADKIKKYPFLTHLLTDTQYIVLSDSEPDFHSLIQWLQANCPPTGYYYFR